MKNKPIKRGRPLVYSDEIINQWVNLYKSGYSIERIRSIYKAKGYTIKEKIVQKGCPVNRKKRKGNSVFDYEKLLKKDKNGCLIFTGAKNGTGYGIFKMRPMQWLTHRLSYCLSKGDCTGKFVCHICDNPACCNPDHLFLSDQKGNLVDMAKKFRCARNNLTALQVLEIKELLSKNVKPKNIAFQLNVKPMDVYNIKKSITYKWLNSMDDVIIQTKKESK